MKPHEKRLFDALHNVSAASREKMEAGLGLILEQKHKDLQRRFEPQLVSQKTAEPMIRKLFPGASEFTLPVPKKLAPASAPIAIPRPEKSWLKHGSMLLVEVPPFDRSNTMNVATGGGQAGAIANVNGDISLTASVDGDNDLDFPPALNPGDGGTAACDGIVAMFYTPPGLACGQGVTNGFMTASTSVSFSCNWEAGSKLWASGSIEFSVSLLVCRLDPQGSLLPIGNQSLTVDSENDQDFLNITQGGKSGTAGLIVACDVNDASDYAIIVSATIETSAVGGFGEIGFLESFTQGKMQVSVPSIVMTIIYPSS